MIRDYKGKIDDFDVIETLKQEFKDQFPDTPESSPDKPDSSSKDYESQSDDEYKSTLTLK